jgi:hypothetical protein
MGIGLRFCIVGDNGEVTKLSTRRFDALHEGSASLPEYANQTVHYAQVIVQLEDRRVVEILRIDGFKMKLDANGRLSEDERFEEMRAAVECADLGLLASESPPNVIRAGSVFARRAYAGRYRWQPNPFELEAICRAVLPT